MSDIKQVLSAAAYAAHHHREQRRKGGDDVPYVNHVLEVARILAAEGGEDDPVLLTAALLHDVVEDTPVAIEDVRERFGPDVADVVAEVTDDKTLPKAERKRLQVVHAPKKSRRAKVLKLADKISNVRDLVASPPDWSEKRLREYGAWADDVVAGLRGENPALDAAFDAALEQLGRAYPA